MHCFTAVKLHICSVLKSLLVLIVYGQIPSLQRGFAEAR
jgi:hypothetical protein